MRMRPTPKPGPWLPSSRASGKRVPGSFLRVADGASSHVSSRTWAPPEAIPDFFSDLPEFLVGYLCRLSWAEHPPEVLSILD